MQRHVMQTDSSPPPIGRQAALHNSAPSYLHSQSWSGLSSGITSPLSLQHDLRLTVAFTRLSFHQIRITTGHFHCNSQYHLTTHYSRFSLSFGLAQHENIQIITSDDHDPHIKYIYYIKIHFHKYSREESQYLCVFVHITKQ